MHSIKIPFITIVLVVLMSIVGLANSQKYHFNDGFDTFYSQEGGIWKQGKGWMYTKPDGTEAIGWTIIDGDYHYFNENGWMYMDCYTPDGYYVDSDGVWVNETANVQAANTDTISGYYVHSYGEDLGEVYYRTDASQAYIHIQKIDDNTIIYTDPFIGSYILVKNETGGYDPVEHVELGLAFSDNNTVSVGSGSCIDYYVKC